MDVKEKIGDLILGYCGDLPDDRFDTCYNQIINALASARDAGNNETKPTWIDDLYAKEIEHGL